MKLATNTSTVFLPLKAMKCLYKSARGKKVVCEIDVSALRRVNTGNAIDNMVTEARLESALGKTKHFTDAKKLMAYLNQ